MKFKFIGPAIDDQLKIGEIYDCEDHSDPIYLRVCINEDRWSYYRSRFEEVEGQSNTPLKEGKHVLYFDDREEIYYNGELIHTYIYNKGLLECVYNTNTPIDLSDYGLIDTLKLVIDLNERGDVSESFKLVLWSDKSANIEDSNGNVVLSINRLIDNGMLW